MRTTSTLCAALLGAAALVACGERSNSPTMPAPDPSSPARVPAPDATPMTPAPGSSSMTPPATPPAEQKKP
ncbi:MAG: hypothetical protein EOO29_15990 [Comamonadaceae bacterium]|nr:MAG: hypothetical protein EOO29_15990 [Comamonadaceae bacterium]